jgi:uncharacterized membrane protein
VRRWFPPFLIAADLAFTAAVYGRLPDTMATHFGTNGPNGWSSRAIGALVVPAVTIAVWLLLLALPYIDPRRANYAKFRGAYDTLIAGTVVFLVVIHVALLGGALGWPVRVEAVVAFAVGGLFVLIGLILPRAESTWFFGIRTPWTLTNDIVWKRTQQMGGLMMMIAGVAIMALSVLRSRTAAYGVVILAAVLILSTLPYSYFVWRSLDRSTDR